MTNVVESNIFKPTLKVSYLNKGEKQPHRMGHNWLDGVYNHASARHQKPAYVLSNAQRSCESSR